MVRSPRPAAVAAQQAIRASFDTPYPFEDEISDSKMINPTRHRRSHRPNDGRRRTGHGPPLYHKRLERLM